VFRINPPIGSPAPPFQHLILQSFIIITNNQTDRSILRQKKIVLHKPKKDLDPALEMSVGEINLGIG
jgi:hypothetical protein